jgi:hypothetical protein
MKLRLKPTATSLTVLGLAMLTYGFARWNNINAVRDLSRTAYRLAPISSVDHYLWISDHELLVWDSGPLNRPLPTIVTNLFDASANSQVPLQLVPASEAALPGGEQHPQIHCSPDMATVIVELRGKSASETDTLRYIKLHGGDTGSLDAHAVSGTRYQRQWFLKWDGPNSFLFKAKTPSAIEIWRCELKGLQTKLHMISREAIWAGNSIEPPVITYDIEWSPVLPTEMRIMQNTVTPQNATSKLFAIFQLPTESLVQGSGWCDATGAVPLQYFDPDYPAYDLLIHRLFSRYKMHAHPLSRIGVYSITERSFRTIGVLPIETRTMSRLTATINPEIGFCCHGQKLWFVYNDAIYTMPVTGKMNSSAGN